MDENKKRGKVIVYSLFLAVAVFGLWLWSKVYTGGKLVYKIFAPQSIKLDGAKVVWMQPVQITNPTNTGILLKLIQFDVKLKGSVLGSGFLSDTIIIKSLEQTTILVPCSVSALEIVFVFPDLLKEIKDRKVVFDLVGNINAEGFTVGVESQAIINIPQIKL